MIHVGVVREGRGRIIESEPAQWSRDPCKCFLIMHSDSSDIIRGPSPQGSFGGTTRRSGLRRQGITRFCDVGSRILFGGIPPPSTKSISSEPPCACFSIAWSWRQTEVPGRTRPPAISLRTSPASASRGDGVLDGRLRLGQNRLLRLESHGWKIVGEFGDRPPMRASNRFFTGTRVPAKTGIPPRISESFTLMLMLTT